MRSTPRSNRIHISIFGRRNVGKSSLINAITGQETALVSRHPGTTTDPVYKSMEILPLGPCVIIDTAGLDDEGELGDLRIKKTRKVLNKSDVALLVVGTDSGWSEFEESLIMEITALGIPCLVVVNKSDLDQKKEVFNTISAKKLSVISVSSTTLEGIHELKEKLVEIGPDDWQRETIVGDLVSANDLVMLVIPIDDAMPKNRLILPEVQMLRELLDHDCDVLVTKETDLAGALKKVSIPPKLVITDSQVFEMVSMQIPEDIPLTSFSILYARYKGDLKTLVNGVLAVETLMPGDRIYMAEACTHHPQEDDIARVKIPCWLEKKIGGKLKFHVGAGGEFPDDCSPYKLIVHCGACMINRRQALHNIYKATAQGVPITNYGVLIAYLKGILPRVLKPLSVFI